MNCCINSTPLKLISLALFAITFNSNAFGNKPIEKPKLIIQITVDQLRGDLMFRYQDRFVGSGFNYLLNNGTVYRDAHHGHANTETIVGHATLATGAHPSNHGLVGNIWYNRQKGHTVYNIEDSNYVLLTKGASVDKNTEIDPTQKAASVEGRSPNTIMASTFSDEMVINSNGNAKVFAVSVKDRGAVSMAGHGGKAFWFSKKSQEFVSSSYYYNQYPKWLNEWNDKKISDNYKNKKWQLLDEKSTYLFGNSDDRAWEMDLAGYGRTFPHPLGESKYFSTLLTVSPFGDEMTAGFAKQLIHHEQLGQDNVTDYLAVSFSATDYIGHFFGASSLESEDNILRLDRTLEGFFAYIDDNIGLDNTVIVLSADHGGPDAPGYLNEHDVQGAYVSPKQWDTLDSIIKLKAELGLKEPLISSYHHPYIYLDQTLIAKNKLDLNDVQDKVAAALLKETDVYHTVASNKVKTNQLADTQLNKAIKNNFYPARSGDIYVVFKPQNFINNLDGLKVASVHGSAWSYDTFVPIIFVGKTIPAKHVYRRVQTVDVAPTLSAIMAIKPPSASNGVILTEVFNQ
ncbi:alkaline phosphatase family protein [Thalassotalea nanhaiensis]|uniref:Alkaline phosphatase family protein n=1 Tax=Thalassotalea nanhaiensis TaxID=3065648 RepID=A0ABY9TFD8_9GAMM|nr:alkaline phosphatase family protein [Colwelliaceae bacterium SQ345]